MPTIQPARLKPGVSRESAVAAISTVEEGASTAIIRGRALIIWDLKIPGKKKKLDAIDTDQITPATDCVSESLETLDERWKAGAFRYLMPDFRARVHRGETFASSALMAPMSDDLVANIKRFAVENDIPLIQFAKDQRKDDIAKEHLACHPGSEGILFIGKAQVGGVRGWGVGFHIWKILSKTRASRAARSRYP